MPKTMLKKVSMILSIVLFIAFFLKTFLDYLRYSSTLNSAPFYIWIIMNVVYFVIPAIILLIVWYKNRDK